MDWLAHELLTGFQKLLCLGLERTPASDLIEGTVLAWHEAITAGREWDRERDTPRIRAAFVSLAGTRDTWPQPRHFLDALPRIEQKAIAYEAKPLSPEEADKRLAEIRGLLADRAVVPPAEQPKREGPPLADTERELQEHYTDRKSAAAGSDA